MQENGSLIDALTAGGEVVAKGEFTLDRDKAREKMQQFQLADPRMYVLELVQAAHLTGAGTINFQIDADDMIMCFDGRPFSATDFDQVYGSIFARGSAPELQARRHLALGLNAAMALNPRWLRVRSGNASLEIRPGEPDVIQTLEQAVAQTEIHIKERFRPGLLVQFFKDISGSLPEEIFIRDKCIYARAKTWLDGALVTGGDWLPWSVVRVDIADEHTTGVAGLLPGWDPEVRLLTNGVWITTHPLDKAVPGFVAIVEGNKLTKDVSQANIVKDEAYKAVLAGLRRAELRCLESLCNLPVEKRNDWTRSVIKHALSDLKSLDQLRKHRTATKLASVALWMDARGGDATISLARLAELFDKEKKVPYSSDAVLNLEPDPAAPIPLITDRLDRQILTRLFGDKIHNVVRKLNNQVASVRNERRWKARKTRAELSSHQPYLARGLVRANGVEGEVGITSLTTASSRLTLIKDGCLLAHETVELPVRALDAVIQADFVPTSKFDGARRSDAWAEALLAVARVLPDLVQALVGGYESWPRRLWTDRSALRQFVTEYLGFALDPTAPAVFLGACGASDSSSKRHATRSGIDPSSYAPRLGVAQGEETTPIGRLELFETLGGDSLSLAQIATRVRDSGPVRYVGDDIELVPELRPEGVLLLTETQRRIVRAALGRDALVSFEKGYVAARLEREFFRKPKEKAILLNRGVACVPVETADGIHGEIAVLDSHAADVAENEQALPASLRLLKHDRHLGHHEVALPFGPVVGVINFDDLTPTASWKDVAPDDKLQALRVAVVEAAGKLLETTCAAFDSGDPSTRAAARRILLRAACVIVARDQRLDLPKSAVEALADARLFTTIFSRSTSIANLTRHLQANGKIFVVDSGAGLAPAGDRLIVAVNAEERRLLRELFGRDALEDSTAWLRARHSRATFLRRARLEQIRVADVIVKSKIVQDGIEGEVGLASYHPGVGATAVIELCTERRRVGILEARGSCAYRARLNDAELPIDDCYNLLDDDPRIEHLRRLCLAEVPGLMLALAERWERLDPARRTHAWHHVLDFVATGGGDPERASNETEREAARRFWALQFFRGADQKLYSLDELRASVEAVGFLAYLTAPLPGRPLNPKQIVIVPSEPELAALRRLFPKVIEYNNEWLEEQEGGRRKRRAPDLPEGPPRDALVTREFRTDRLDGVLWLPADGLTPLMVQLGKLGKVAQARRASAFFPCCGIVTGDNLRVSRTWDAVELTRKQQRSLERNARVLYDELRQRLDKEDDLNGEARERAERLLLRAAVQLYNAAHAPGRRVRVDTPSRHLCGKLEHMPLLRTGSGRRISLQKAIEDRIPELHTLGVWQPRPAEPENRPDGRRIAGAPPDVPELPFRVRDRRRFTEQTARIRSPISDAQRHRQAAERAVIEALIDELRWTREERSELLSDANLHRMTFCDDGADVVAHCTQRGVILHRRHPLVAQALKGFANRPILITFLASAVYSALNLFWKEITDDHERDFHRALVDHVLTACDSRPARQSP